VATEYTGASIALLLENGSRTADTLPFQRDIYFDTISDPNKGNAFAHSVVFAVEGHRAFNASGGRALRFSFINPLGACTLNRAFRLRLLLKIATINNLSGCAISGACLKLHR
jgi:hypothetical protein